MDAESSQRGQTSVTNFRIQDEESPIIYLDIQPRTEFDAEDPNPNLVVIHRNGQIRVVSGDLKRELKNEAVSQKLDGKPGQPICVEHACFMDIQQAKKALLKGREDVLDMIQDSNITAQPQYSLGLSLLVLMVRSSRDGTNDRSDEVTLRVFAVRPTGPLDSVFSNSNKSDFLNELISIPIPELRKLNEKPSSYILHGPSGTLYQRSSLELNLYKISGLVLRPAHKISLSHRKVYSLLRITSYTMFVLGEENLDIMDATHGSVQARVSVSLQEEARRNRGKSKKKGPTKDEHTRTYLLSYFAPLGMVVALQNHRLIVFQISLQPPLESTPRKRSRSGRLVDAIGHAFDARELAKAPRIKRLPTTLKKFIPAIDIGGEWRKAQAELNRCIQHGKVDEFEKLVASELGLSDISTDNWPTGHDHVIPGDQTKVSYMLSKIFGLKTEAESAAKGTDEDLWRLKITFFPPRIFRFLVSRGYIMNDQIERSLQRHGLLSVTSCLAADALIHAIVEMDESLTELLLLLEGPFGTDPPSLAHVIHVAIEGMQNREPDEMPKLLMSGEEAHNIPDQDDDSAFQPPHPNPSEEMTNPHSSCSTTASRILGHALDNLSIYDPTTITTVLRKSLSPSNLRHLIDVLRMSLAQNGWLTLYTNPLSPPSASMNLKSGLANTLKVLDSTLTAIGTSGFLLSTALPADQATETADTITYMKAETSAALEGIQEATYLKGALGEILLYADTLVKQKRDKKMVIDDSKELPLGMKATQPIEMTKVGAGGEIQKRSMRDIGRLKSRRIGKYTFERIVI